jgi:hypothetical protein
MAYFRYLPNLYYPSLRNERSSSNDYTLIKNIFKRAKIREDFINIFTAFEKYSIVGDDRPDNVAELLYGDPNLDWIILITNNIQNIREDWPLSQADLNLYLNQKYTPEELSQIHHYETKEVKASDYSIILPAGLVVGEDFTISYSDGSQLIEDNNCIISVSNYEYELRKNDDKRNIYALRQEYISLVEEDLRLAFANEPSSEYVDIRTLKTSNPRRS